MVYVDWITLAQDVVKWRALVNIARNTEVPQGEEYVDQKQDYAPTASYSQ
jgi:hypothetical protein